MGLVEEVKFNEAGLVPAIIQDYQTNEILMLAYMNKESLELTLQHKQTYFWSRSRQQLWHKGETSGNIQHVKEIYLDCDNDTILTKVQQVGVACHTGARSCFFRKFDQSGKEIRG